MVLDTTQDLCQLLLELALHLPAQLNQLINLNLMPKLIKLVVQALQVGGRPQGPPAFLLST